MKELLQQALDALTRLSFLGNGDFPGNSEGNRIAQKAVSDIKQALAQQEQPASVDAYVGAREDAAIWKKRALEAEGLNRKFIAEVNGPTYLGEPVKQEQPAQEPVVAHPIGFDYLDSGQLVATYALPVEGKNHPKLYTHPAPTQPALSESQITSIAYNCNALPEVITDKTLVDFVRAIEAHCRGGQA